LTRRNTSVRQVILSDRRLERGGSRRISSHSAETPFQKDVDLKLVFAIRQKDSSTLAIKIASIKIASIKIAAIKITSLGMTYR